MFQLLLTSLLQEQCPWLRKRNHQLAHDPVLEAKPRTLGVYISTHANEFSSESHSQGHCNYNTEIETLIMNVEIYIITFYYCL